MEHIKLIFSLMTHTLLNVNFQELYLPLFCAGLVGFTILMFKRRCLGHV